MFYYLFLAFIFEFCSIIYLDKFILSKRPKLINHFIFLLLYCMPYVLFLFLIAQLTTSQNQENKHAKQQNYQYNNE